MHREQVRRAICNAETLQAMARSAMPTDAEKALATDCKKLLEQLLRPQQLFITGGRWTWCFDLVWLQRQDLEVVASFGRPQDYVPG